MSEPREYTAAEVRNMFLNHLADCVDYWARECPAERSTERRLQGLVHSILCVFDGVSGALPAFDVRPSPHAEDRAYYRDIGENWWPEGTISLHDDAPKLLHDAFYDALRKRGRI